MSTEPTNDELLRVLKQARRSEGEPRYSLALDVLRETLARRSSWSGDADTALRTSIDDYLNGVVTEN